jgi:outer membrane protein OmpA-like peptidoglycan-associated protein
MTLTVIGRTDASGSVEVNQRIGMARAQAIVDRLVSQGASPAQLMTESRGESDATPSAVVAAGDRFAQIIVNGSLT